MQLRFWAKVHNVCTDWVEKALSWLSMLEEISIETCNGVL